MAQNDLYEATFVILDNNEFTYNVFYFQGLQVSSNAFDLGFRLDAQWATEWSLLIGDDMFIDSVSVRNIFNPDDATFFPIATQGTGVGDKMPSYTALYASLPTDRASIKNGRKMFGGILETHQENGTFTNAYVTLWQTFLDDYVVPPVVGQGGGDAYQQVVIKRIKYVTPNGNVAYRLPLLPSEADFGNVIDAVASNVVRTQTSRKTY